jgi:hypothetical protein
MLENRKVAQDTDSGDEGAGEEIESEVLFGEQVAEIAEGGMLGQPCGGFAMIARWA